MGSLCGRKKLSDFTSLKNLGVFWLWKFCFLKDKCYLMILLPEEV